MTHASLSLLQIGDVLAGKYRVERVLGMGGMGMVVAAMHMDLRERRAIKFMLPTALGDAEGLERFMREARACAKLKSKHVAAVYDVGRLENGSPYIVMEYLEGTDLKTVLQNQRALPVTQAVDYMLQALEAVGEAHQAGIVHRDLKPANIFIAAGVGGAPCVKILDFGIAKVTPSTVLGTEVLEMTSTAAVMGSPLYMSPEQMRSSRQVDARSDIWSLGVILYRMVTGTLPFQAPTPLELFAIILQDAPKLPSLLNPMLPEGFEAVVMKCLNKDPSQRWNSASELTSALRPYTSERQDSSVAADLDSTTRHWRPSQVSLPDGWYGAPSETVSDSASRLSANPAPAGGSVQIQTTPRVTDGTAPMPGRGVVSAISGPPVQTGPSTATSAPKPVDYPPLRNSQPAIPIDYHPSRNPHPPISAVPAGYSPPPDVGYEAGTPGQTGGSWSKTGIGAMLPTGTPRALIAVGLGGTLLVGGIVLLFVMLNRSSTASGSPPLQPTAATEQVAPPAQEEPMAPPGGQEPKIAATNTSTASSAAVPSTAQPQTTQKATPRPPSTTLALPKPVRNPPPKQTKRNPFD